MLWSSFAFLWKASSAPHFPFLCFESFRLKEKYLMMSVLIIVFSKQCFLWITHVNNFNLNKLLIPNYSSILEIQRFSFPVFVMFLLETNLACCSLFHVQFRTFSCTSHMFLYYGFGKENYSYVILLFLTQDFEWPSEKVCSSTIARLIVSCSHTSKILLSLTNSPLQIINSRRIRIHNSPIIIVTSTIIVSEIKATWLVIVYEMKEHYEWTCFLLLYTYFVLRSTSKNVRGLILEPMNIDIMNSKLEKSEKLITHIGWLNKCLKYEHKWYVLVRA